MIDLTKLTPAPWTVEKQFSNGCEITPHINGPDRKWVALVVGSPHLGFDPYPDAEFIALARNAFDVMMRRGWGVKRMPHKFARQWYVGFDSKGFDTILSREKTGYVHCHADPFTALVEADRWYRENVEKQD